MNEFQDSMQPIYDQNSSNHKHKIKILSNFKGSELQYIYFPTLNQQ